MSSYTHRMCICAPLAIIDLANQIGRALDPDTGGDRSFASVLAGPDAATPTHAVCDVIVNTDFAAQAAGMLSHPAYLCGAVAADYATRWTELASPTMFDCMQFVAECLIRIEERGRELTDVLAGVGLVLCTGGEP